MWLTKDTSACGAGRTGCLHMIYTTAWRKLVDASTKNTTAGPKSFIKQPVINGLLTMRRRSTVLSFLDVAVETQKPARAPQAAPI